MAFGVASRISHVCCVVFRALHSSALFLSFLGRVFAHMCCVVSVYLLTLAFALSCRNGCHHGEYGDPRRRRTWRLSSLCTQDHLQGPTPLRYCLHFTWNVCRFEFQRFWRTLLVVLYLLHGQCGKLERCRKIPHSFTFCSSMVFSFCAAFLGGDRSSLVNPLQLERPLSISRVTW